MEPDDAPTPLEHTPRVSPKIPACTASISPPRSARRTRGFGIRPVREMACGPRSTDRGMGELFHSVSALQSLLRGPDALGFSSEAVVPVSSTYSSRARSIAGRWSSRPSC